MIRIDCIREEREIDGTGIELLTELTELMRTMFEMGVLTKEKLQSISELAMLSDSELVERARSLMEKREEDPLFKIYGDILN